MIKICEIRYFGAEPVPWTVVEVGVNRQGKTPRPFVTRSRKTKQDAGTLSLADWQDRIRQAALKVMKDATTQKWHGLNGMLTAAVKLDFVFYAETPVGKRHGELWDVELIWKVDKKTSIGRWGKREPRGCKEPDLTNLEKAAEDAVQGTVFPDDVKVRMKSSVCLFGPQPGVQITVWAIEATDFPGHGDPVKPLV